MSDYCSKEFIFNNVPGRLKAISDLASMASVNKNNYIYYNFKIFVC